MYTTGKSVSFWKVGVKLCNCRVPVYKGAPCPWMKWNPSLNDDCWPTIQVWKDSLSEKWVLKYATLGFLFIGGSPPLREMTPILKRWLLAKCTSVKSLTFWKVGANLYNLRVPVYNGVPSHEWNDTLPWTMTAGQLYQCEKIRFLKN